MFIKQPNTPKAKIINLDNVSNVGVDIGKLRLIFNFQHSINIFNGGLSPDYVYMDFDTSKEMGEMFGLIAEKCKDAYFISENPANRMVNHSAVCSINIEESRNRIIFNLNHPISSKDRSDDKVSSNFVFWNFESKDSFETSRDSITDLLAID